jgi:hypothetical protein
LEIFEQQQQQQQQNHQHHQTQKTPTVRFSKILDNKTHRKSKKINAMYEESSSSSGAAAASASASTSTSKQQRLNKSAQENRVETGADKRLIIKNKKFLSASVNSTPTTTSTKKSSKI